MCNGLDQRSIAKVRLLKPWSSPVEPIEMADLYGVWVGIGRDEAQTLPAVLSSIATASGLFLSLIHI